MFLATNLYSVTGDFPASHVADDTSTRVPRSNLRGTSSSNSWSFTAKSSGGRSDRDKLSEVKAPRASALEQQRLKFFNCLVLGLLVNHHVLYIHRFRVCRCMFTYTVYIYI